MKNRDRYILKRNEYDLLVALQVAFGSGLCYCVIEAVTGKSHYCPDNKVCMLDTCKECLQKWLNEDS